jgi:hypothetical protein
MIFEEYLSQKNINHETFLWSEPEEYILLKSLFSQMHPNSFTEQKKFLINKLRRKYMLKVF